MLTGGKLYHSGHVLVLARRSYERIGDYRSESQIPVILATVALEGFVNELEHQAEFAASLGSSVVAATVARALRMAEDGHASILLKINIAYLAMSGALPDTGSQPYQDIELLIRLRNLLVHARPESVEFGEPGVSADFPKIVRSFASRGVIRMPPNGSAIAWQQYVLVPSVAAWAHNTAVRAIRWLAAAAPEEWLRMFLQLQADGLTEIESSGPAV
jgi:hypothetical protein